MGEKNFQTFKDELKFSLGQRDDLTAAWLGGTVNDAYIQLVSSRSILKTGKLLVFPELEKTDRSQTLLDGTFNLSIPYHALVIRLVVDSTSSHVLSRITEDRYWKLRYTGDTGQPKYWSRSPSNINILPRADDDYAMAVVYRKRPDLLSSSSDTTAIGTEWDEPISTMAAIKAHLKLGEFEKANIKNSFLIDQVAQLQGLWEEEKLNTENYIYPHPNLLDKDFY